MEALSKTGHAIPCNIPKYCRLNNLYELGQYTRAPRAEIPCLSIFGSLLPKMLATCLKVELHILLAYPRFKQPTYTELPVFACCQNTVRGLLGLPVAFEQQCPLRTGNWSLAGQDLADPYLRMRIIDSLGSNCSRRTACTCPLSSNRYFRILSHCVREFDPHNGPYLQHSAPIPFTLFVPGLDRSHRGRCSLCNASCYLCPWGM
jgi:hypothetical protein